MNKPENSSTVTGVVLIGHMTVPDQGCFLITNQHGEVKLKAQGWERE
jgi:thiamine-monophosphate kinase